MKGDLLMSGAGLQTGIGRAAARPYRDPHRRQRGPYTFLRNEPTVFGEEILCIMRVLKYFWICRATFAGGFVFGNEPTGPPSRGRYGATRPTRRGFLRGIERELGSFQGGNEGTGGGAGATAWGIFELLKAFSFSKGCWFRERCFDKSRNPAGSRRMTGLSMTDRRETKMAERAIF
jgi:hypothetical protein